MIWEWLFLSLKKLYLHFLCTTSNTTKKKTWKLKGHWNFSPKRTSRVSILNSFNNSVWSSEHLSSDSEISFTCLWNHNHVCYFLWLLVGAFLFVLTGGNLLHWETGSSGLLCPNPCYFLFQRKMGFWLLDDWWNGFPVRRPSWEVVAERWRWNREVSTC